METSFVRVYEAEREFNAQAIYDLLREDGIQALMQAYPRDYMALYFGSSAAQPWGELLVPEDKAERALELIGGFLGKLAMLGELSPEELEAAALDSDDAERESEI